MGKNTQSKIFTKSYFWSSGKYNINSHKAEKKKKAASTYVISEGRKKAVHQLMERMEIIKIVLECKDNYFSRFAFGPQIKNLFEATESEKL